MVTVIIAAGGRGRRMGAGVPKQLLAVAGRPILQMSVEAFAAHPRVDALVVVLPADLAAEPPDYLRARAKPLRLVVGGDRRQDSVANGLAVVDDASEVVIVHDAARPFVDEQMIDRAIDAARQAGAAICAVPSRDTVKVAERDASDDVWIDRTLPRDSIFLAQTPQAFRREVLADAVRLGQAGVDGTDEAFLAEQAGHRVQLVEGSARNIKITSAEDLIVAEALARGRAKPEGGSSKSGEPQGSDVERRTSDAGRQECAIGLGYDIHRLVEGRRLVLGGVEIPYERGLLGHSDADAVCHAITDAILGAAGAGDIGRHFPDTDDAWRDASSIDLLGRALCIVRERGFVVGNVDVVVVAQRPRLAPHAGAMCERLAAALDVPMEAVSVKGKTSEGLGEIGRGEAIACHAVALLRKTI